MKARAASRTLGMACLAALSVLVTIAAIALPWANWERLYVYAAGWSSTETAIFSAGWASVALLQAVGLWLWWRSPRNATGLWLWIAGLSLGLWFVGGYWETSWGYVVRYSIYLFRPALVIAFLGWPTGRPARGVMRWIVGVSVAYFVLGLTINLFADGQAPETWPADPIARFEVPWITQVFGPITAWMLLFIPAVAVIVLLVRQQRSVPRGAHHLITVLTVAGVITFGTDVFMMVITTLGAGLLWDSVPQRSTALGLVVLLENYAQGAIAAVGLAIAFVGRRRMSRTSTAGHAIELGRSPAIASPSLALQRLLDDPTARLLYTAGDGRLIDASGEIVATDIGDRHRTVVCDSDGTELAVLDCDGAATLHPVLLEVVAATIVNRVESERATAIATARHGELVALQHALLDASDAARRRMERDLHDGAQQGLVGLALAARLLDRSPSDSAVTAFRDELTQARMGLAALLGSGIPSVLEGGLGTALMTLGATTVIPTDVKLRGDVTGDNPIATTLWFIAAEAVANSVKHASPSKITIDLRSVAPEISLSISDDGRGGMISVPEAIARRVGEAGGRASIASAPLTGTTVTVWFDVSRQAVA